MSSLVPRSSPSSVIFNLTLDPCKKRREVSSHDITYTVYTIMCCDVSKGIYHVIDHPGLIPPYFAGVKGQIGKIADE